MGWRGDGEMRRRGMGRCGDVGW